MALTLSSVGCKPVYHRSDSLKIVLRIAKTDTSFSLATAPHEPVYPKSPLSSSGAPLLSCP